MKIKVFFLICVVAFSSILNAQDLKTYKSHKSFKFNIDNSKPSSFGYKYFEDDMDVGVMSIFTHNNNIYIPDRFHSNLKVIDIEKKEVLVSEELVNWISDAFIYNDTIYVVSDFFGYRQLDKNLNIVYSDDNFLPKGSKAFIELNDEYYIVNYFELFYEEYKRFYPLYRVSTLQKSNIETIKVGSDNLPLRVGYSNVKKVIDNKEYLVFRDSFYELPFKLKDVEDYKANNIYVDEKTNMLTHFFINENIIEINILYYH